MDLFAAENELRAWTSDELLYREFRLVRSGQFPLELFLEKYKGDEKNLDYVFHPESISKLHPETSFFREGRNISLRKHPCCFPLFFHAHTFFEMFYVYSGSCVQHFDTGTSVSYGTKCDPRH